MNLPERMPVMGSVDRIRRQWLTALCGADCLYGLINMFGKAEGAAAVLVRGIIPWELWSSLLLASGILIWFGWSIYGAVLGCLAWLGLGAAAVVTLTIGTALSTSGPVLPLFLALLHGLITFEVHSGLDADRERRQRRK